MTPETNAPAVGIALVHYPVFDKNKDVVTTAVTNLDIHDIARAAKTYGLDRYYLVTPVNDQQELVARVRDHWIHGWGATYNPKRRAALELLSLVPTLDEAMADMEERFGARPRLVMTGARARGNSTSYTSLAGMMKEDGAPWLLVFGTGWGLTDEIMTRADINLDPIVGPGDYNHLSVRSAVSIILDRLRGRSDQQAVDTLHNESFSYR